MATHYSLLISPLAKNAYFNHVVSVARAELAFTTGIREAEEILVGGLHFLRIECEPSLVDTLLKLSFVQGIFESNNHHFQPLEKSNTFLLHEDFVFGAKYKGKTNETLTQQLLNLGIAACKSKSKNLKLLDPMCGRGTTLFWALRYGLNAKGIERDVKVLPEIRQQTKKWCKIHRQKHILKEGFVGKSNRKQHGKFLDFEVENKHIRVISGDSREASTLLSAETFDLIVSDLPYGVQHTTQDGKRNASDTISECANTWAASMKLGAAMVLAFNKYIPKRENLIQILESTGLQKLDFEAPHRMSESIVRDIVILRK